MGVFNVCSILLVLGVVIRYGFGTPLELTITPTKTPQVSSEDVVISYRPGTSLNPAAILLIKITKTGQSTPLASVYQNHKAMSYTTNKSTIAMEATGHIDDKTLANSFLTLMLQDPTYKQSGSYECEVTYLDVMGQIIIVKSSREVKVTMPDIISLDRVITDLRNQIEGLNQTSSSRDDVIKAIMDRLTKQEEKLSYLDKEFSKYTDSSKKHSIQQDDNLKAIIGGLKKRLNSQALTIKKYSQDLSTDRKLLKSVTKELQETKAKLLNKKERKCPNELWKLVDDKSCFKAYETPATWQNARDICRKEGGTLATILDQFHYDMASHVARLSGISSFWIGLNDIATDGKYVFDNGSPMSFGLWKPGEPNNIQQDCIIQYVDSNPGWDDEFCHFKKSFICQTSTILVDFWQN